MNKKYPHPIALLITDTHLHKNNVDLVKDIFNQAIEKCKELKINDIFHLGDFFTSREAQPLHVLDAAQDILLSIEKSKIQFDICDGNHDKVDLESNNSYIKILYNLITHRIDDVCNSFWYVNNKLFEDFNFIWVPYFKENGSYIKKLEKATKLINKDKRYNILLTHVGVNGVNNNDGSSVENEVKQELFKKFYKVFVGHYHDQQSIKNIYYIGSAYQSNFGEDENKGFTILYSDGSHEFVRSKFPKFIKEKINIDDKDALKKFEKKYAGSTDHVRAILIGEKTKLQSFKKENFINKGIDCKFESEEINTNSIDGGEIQLYDRSNISKAFDSFCELNSIEDKEFGKKYLESIL